MYQSTLLGLLFIGAFTACGANSHEPVGSHRDPLSPTSSPEAGPGDTGSGPTNCYEVECPPPPADWCTSGAGNIPLPQWLVEYWNGTCEAAAMSCGDGIIDEAELCDDGNTVSGDGCDATCSAIEAGFECGVAGQPCQ